MCSWILLLVWIVGVDMGVDVMFGIGWWDLRLYFCLLDQWFCREGFVVVLLIVGILGCYDIGNGMYLGFRSWKQGQS